MRLTIEPLILSKIMYWVRKAGENEISGFGKIISHEGNPHIIEACLLSQENTPGSTEIDAQSLCRAMYEMRDKEGHLNYWWHSHGTGTAYFSHTDYQTIERLGGHGDEPQAIVGARDVISGMPERQDDLDSPDGERLRTGSWLIASVFNSRGENQNAFLSTAPIRIFADHLSLCAVNRYVPQGSFQAWDSEYNKNIRLAPKRLTRLKNRHRRRFRHRSYRFNDLSDDAWSTHGWD